MESVISGFLSFSHQFYLSLNPYLLFISAIGTTLGLIWGAMPALSSTMAMALLVGFSYKMGLDTAIMFLMGVYTGSVFGGSISAIYINIPGTPAAVCTAIEGFPLAKKGEGPLALGTAIVSSAIGNSIGIIFLILFFPFLIAAALKFGAWELFLLSMWGIGISGSITGGDEPALKGWISGWLGFLISMVGLENIHAYPRFTFGINALYNGVSFVPILIGLFGLAEVLKTLPDVSPYVIKKEGKGVQLLPAFGIAWKYLRTTVRSGLIGAFIGALPALGADVAAFTAYAVAKRKASREDLTKYGRGAYEGIVAAETANNASIGGSLLPLLTLTVPGSTVAAAYLGALNLHNVVVGPMIEFNHPGLVYFHYAALIIASFFMSVIAVVMARPTLYLFSIPRQILLPIIVPICVIGAYASTVTMFDIYVMLFFGIMGYLLSMNKFALGPMCMGVILGPMADLNFRRAVEIYGDQPWWTVLSRPVGDVLIVLVLWTYFDGIFRRRKIGCDG